MAKRKEAQRHKKKDTRISTIPMGNHVETDSELHSKSNKPPLEPDELMKPQALREAARAKRDQYLVETDLEDADQRFPLPNMKEQK